MGLEEIRYGENITRDDERLRSSSEEYRRSRGGSGASKGDSEEASGVERQVVEWGIPKLWRKYAQCC